MKFIKLSFICIASCFTSISCASTFTKLNSLNNSSDLKSNEVNEEEYCYLSFNATHYTINNHNDQNIKIIKNKDNVCFTIVHEDEYKALTVDQIKEENDLPFLFNEETQVLTIKRMTSDYSFTINDEKHINYMFTFKGNHCRARVDGTHDSYETVLNIDISELGNAPRLNLKCDDGFTFDKSTTEIQVYLDDIKSTNYDLFVDETSHDKADIVAYGRWKNVFLYVNPKGTEPAPSENYTLNALGVNCVSDNEGSKGKTMFMENHKAGDEVELHFMANDGFEMPSYDLINVVASNLEEPIEFSYDVSDDLKTGTVSFTYPACNVSVIVPCQTFVWTHYYVNYVDNIGGVSNMPEKASLVEENHKATKPTKDPTLNGYEFKYWTDNAESKTEFDFENTAITKNIELYPVFEKSTKKFINFKYDNSKINTIYKGEVVDSVVLDEDESSLTIKVDPTPMNKDMNKDVFNEFLDFDCFVNNKPTTFDYSFNKENWNLTINNVQTSDILISFKYIDEISWDFIGTHARCADLQFFMTPGDVKRYFVEGNQYDIVYLGIYKSTAIDPTTKDREEIDGLSFEFRNVISDKDKNPILAGWNNGLGDYFYNSECHKKMNEWCNKNLSNDIGKYAKTIEFSYSTLIETGDVIYQYQYTTHADKYSVADMSQVVLGGGDYSISIPNFPYYDSVSQEELNKRRIKYDLNGNPVDLCSLRTPYAYFMKFDPNPYCNYLKDGTIDFDYQYRCFINKYQAAPIFIF